jgi:hypothetical protein
LGFSDGEHGASAECGVRNAECGMRSGGQTTERDVASPGEPVLSTEYLVQSTAANSQSDIPNPKSQIPNLKSSVEETALAVEALLAAVLPSPEPRTPSPAAQAAFRGLYWLIDRVEAGQHWQPAPIGFYFAKLWYYEKLYPLIFTVAALGRACRQFALPTEARENPTEPASADARSRTTSWKTQP